MEARVKLIKCETCLICNCKRISDAQLAFYNIFNTIIRAKPLSKYFEELFDVQIFERSYVGSRIMCELCVDSIDGFIELKKIAYSSNIFFDKNTPKKFNPGTLNFIKQDPTLIQSTSSASGNNFNPPISDIVDLCDSSNDSLVIDV